MGMVNTKVKGIHYSNKDGTSREEKVMQLTIMDGLCIKDASSERYPEAISFHTEDGYQIGYVSAGLARQIREKNIPIDSIKVGFPMVSKTYGGGYYDEDGAYIGGGGWRYTCETYLEHPDLIDEKEYEEQCWREKKEKELAEKEAEEKRINKKLKIMNVIIWSIIFTIVGLIIKGISTVVGWFL